MTTTDLTISILTTMPLDYLRDRVKEWAVNQIIVLYGDVFVGFRFRG
jgi:hypothetical protein